MNEQYLLQNAAVTLDGITLDFQGDKCGHSYRIKRETIGSFRYWQCFFYDWHEGWLQINRWPGEDHRIEAIEVCNRHAAEQRLIKFLPHKPKFKANWGGWGSAAASAASVAGFSI